MASFGSGVVFHSRNGQKLKQLLRFCFEIEALKKKNGQGRGIEYPDATRHVMTEPLI